MKEISTIALEEIWKQNTDGHIPVLLEIYNPDIKWGDNELEQENMYLRVIDDSNPVMYKGKRYIPACFEYTPPEEDGKKISEASITLSAIDSRVIQLLRSIEIPCDITVMATFAKCVDYDEALKREKTVFKFYPIEYLKAKAKAASYDRTTARLSLIYKDVMSLNVPRDIATKNQLMSVAEDA